jgi:hypothetical protein
LHYNQNHGYNQSHQHYRYCLGISFKVPVWIQKVLGLDVSAQGFSAGFALSYPRFSGGKFDFCVCGKKALEGGGIGFCKGSGGFFFFF